MKVQTEGDSNPSQGVYQTASASTCGTLDYTEPSKAVMWRQRLVNIHPRDILMLDGGKDCSNSGAIKLILAVPGS